ncbi:serine protease [Rhodoferax sp.]|uniref:S1 family peptidase n=1 Tax=Rhodoferax sp. TaxID=50421 RepID=UPI001ED5A9E1|nr:serine protease [Rhodoferax sp.]MBT9506223.1 trypsin-like peptidase domain-containing protein [Rhodoferax sp.]
MTPLARWLKALFLVLCMLGAPGAMAQAAVGAEATLPKPGSDAAPISHDAQRAYQSSRDKLVQIRTLLRNTNTQSSVGSGFFVSADGLIMTNFHVASQLALEPERYRGVYVPVDGKQAEVELLAFDVAHDLALLRVKDAGPQRPALSFRSKDQALERGERLYSLGNPLDIGFAVTEGTYNGLVQRSFYPRIFFGGAINPGMSGGPVIDEAGLVIGINVSKRLDGELLSFLVPAEFAQALLARAATLNPITRKAQAEVTRQLLEHQDQVTKRFTATAFKAQKHGGYSVPVPDDALARCWGRARDADFKAFDLVRTNCQLDSQVFAGETTTGFIRLFFEAYDAPRFSALRFARMYSDSMANERFAMRGTSRMTAAECSERFIDRDGMAMRAVVCMSAYRKLRGLYNVSVLVTSVNRPTQGVQGRMDAHGMSFDNGLALVAYYLNGFKWEGAR